MTFVRLAATAAALVCVFAVPYAAAPLPRATLSSAPTVTLPGTVDSNSPMVWDFEDGQRRLFTLTSHSGVASIAAGSSVDRLGAAAPITITPHPGYGVWMESVITDDVDTWYGFYHNEWPASRCGREDRFVPRIGAARSLDRGRTWEDLGVVLMLRRTATACASTNKYLIGGVGDLSVMLDHDKHYLYFFYSQYPEDATAQGVAVARLQWADRDRPRGRLELWRDGVWDSDEGRRMFAESLPGETRPRLEWTYPPATPLIAPTLPWHDADDKVDAFWGPAVHWNTALEQYVMLLNRAKNENYDQEGIYVSFAPRLDDPALWSMPVKILNGGRWYPQIAGTTPGVGTDKIAGASARFFMSGKSEWMISFSP
jgi:hypothetical protein